MTSHGLTSIGEPSGSSEELALYKNLYEKGNSIRGSTSSMLINFGVSPGSRAKISLRETAAFEMLFENRASVDCPVRRPLFLRRYDIRHVRSLSSAARSFFVIIDHLDLTAVTLLRSVPPSPSRGIGL
jgi:hypothetical protein